MISQNHFNFVLCGSLSRRYDSSSGCGWKRPHPHVECRWEYI